MILVIDALNRDRFGSLLDEMFRLRGRVFGDRLGWEVSVKDGMEIDRFDQLDPAYLVGLDGEGHVVSCARLLQTTGPHMLADVFSSILDGEPPLRSSRIWESTRFCVDTTRLKETGGLRGISRATSEILLGLNDYGMMAGISDVVTVIDPVMDRVLKRSACAPHGYVGSTKPMGKVSALAALLDCSEERGAAIRAFAGIEGNIFLSDDEAAELFARNPASDLGGNVLPFPQPALRGEPKAPVTTNEILDYCTGLMRDATGSEERRKAAMVAREVLASAGLTEQIRLLTTVVSAQPEAVGS